MSLTSSLRLTNSAIQFSFLQLHHHHQRIFNHLPSKQHQHRIVSPPPRVVFPAVQLNSLPTYRRALLIWTPGTGSISIVVSPPPPPHFFFLCPRLSLMSFPFFWTQLYDRSFSWYTKRMTASVLFQQMLVLTNKTKRRHSWLHFTAQ